MVSLPFGLNGDLLNFVHKVHYRKKQSTRQITYLDRNFSIFILDIQYLKTCQNPRVSL